MSKLVFILLIAFASCVQSTRDLTVDFDSFNDETKLVLRSYYHDKSDCGEFGGHHETIQIRKEKDELIYYYKRDSTLCPKEFAVRLAKEPDKPFQAKGRLSVEKQRILKKYLNDLLNHKPSWNLISNAIDTYEIEVASEFWTKTYKLSPVENEWIVYREMSEELLK